MPYHFSANKSFFYSESTASPQPTTNSTILPPDIKAEARRIRVADSQPSKKNMYIAVFTTSFVVLVCFAVGFFICHRKLKSVKGADYGIVSSDKPNEPVVQYRTHAPSLGSSSSYGSTVPLLRQRSLRSRLGSNLTQVSEVEVALDEKWEIDREQIVLLGLLGEGAFGKVMKAEALGLPNMPYRFDVAVKMLKGEL